MTAADLVAPVEDSPEFQYAAAELHNLVQTSLSRLDIDEESLIKLLYVADLTFGQIADDWWIEEPILQATHELILLKLRQDLHWRGINKLADIL